MTNQTIDIINVRQHNLKSLDLSIPLGKITVLTDPSGSGKSTLVLDVLFAEGQYRYLESLGMAVKRIVDLWDRPLVDAIKGLPPPIALDQKPFVRSPRIFSSSHPDGMCISCNGKGKNKSAQPCRRCRGTGLNPFARSVRIEDRTFPDLMTWSVHKTYLWLLSFSMELKTSRPESALSKPFPPGSNP